MGLLRYSRCSPASRELSCQTTLIIDWLGCSAQAEAHVLRHIDICMQSNIDTLHLDALRWCTCWHVNPRSFLSSSYCNIMAQEMLLAHVSSNIGMWTLTNHRDEAVISSSWVQNALMRQKLICCWGHKQRHHVDPLILRNEQFSERTILYANNENKTQLVLTI